jgi:hypothetical protein
MATRDRTRSLGDFTPQLREKSGSTGIASAGVQQVVSVPVGPNLHVDSVTYKGVVFVAPVDGCLIKAMWLSAAVKAAGGTNTLALDNYDASANAARNALSTATIDPTAVPTVVKEGDKLTLSATETNLYMDAGDVLNYTLVAGVQTTQGEGYAVTAIIIVPESL